jgi:antitoxin component of MazEF toxin-antitoxin module
MKRKLQKIGNSYCVIINKSIMQLLDFTPSQEFDLDVDTEKKILILKKAVEEKNGTNNV